MTHEKQWKEVVEKNKNDIQYQSGTQFIPNEKYFQEYKLFQYMLLWKATFCPEYEPNWENEHECKCRIEFIESKKKWVVSYSWGFQSNMQVYLPTRRLVELMLEDLKREELL